jgi:dolichyl-phosphate beta-glucosyltransferase
MTSDVAIIVPTFDEARRLDTAAFERFLGTRDGARLLFVDDGSTDGTDTLLERLATRYPRASVLPLAQNSGKAEAVRCGIVAALDDGAEVVGYWDADLSTPLGAISALLEVLESDPALVSVIASRVRMLGTNIDRRATRHYTGRVFATVASLALGIAVYDTQCGAKLFRATPAVRDAFPRPFRSPWAFDVEILDRLLVPGTSTDEASHLIREVPLTVWRDKPGSKLRLASSLAATWHVVQLGMARNRRG